MTTNKTLPHWVLMQRPWNWLSVLLIQIGAILLALIIHDTLPTLELQFVFANLYITLPLGMGLFFGRKALEYVNSCRDSGEELEMVRWRSLWIIGVVAFLSSLREYYQFATKLSELGVREDVWLDLYSGHTLLGYGIALLLFNSDLRRTGRSTKA